MSVAPDTWREGHRILTERVRALPGLLRAAAARVVGASAPRFAAGRRIVLTGVGSSAAHARFLAHLLTERYAMDAHVLPLSAFLAPRATAADEVLIVFSQGLSPNARIALADPRAWAQVILVTAATEEGARASGDPDKADAVAALRDAGVVLYPLPAGDNEYTTLVRVIGPMAGYVAALRLARGAPGDAAPPLDIDAICAALVAAPDVAEAALSGFDLRSLAAGMGFLTSGTYGELTDNLRYKVLEGMLLPAPPVWDLLHVAHGPLQHAHTGAATFLALTRRGTPGEEDLLALVETALDPDRHRLLRLEARLPGPLAIFEHEALMNEVMLRYIAAAAIDQVRWPGKGRDAALYRLDAARVRGDHPPTSRAPRRPVRRLDALTWPELEALMAGGIRTAVVPLGATEQHGPHLPFATDAWVAEALAERFCERVPEAIHCPVLALGCSSEHLDFPGTLDLHAETLERVLRDVLLSLRRHGFACAFVFSAHGGNYAALRTAADRLRAACAPMRLGIFDDLDGLTAVAHDASAAYGVNAAASGHHAGEFETSIVAALRPEAVRSASAAPGLLITTDPQGMFYPSLRPNAATGVVGDPRAAAAEHGRRYLDAWTDLLVTAYRRASHSA